MGGEGASLRFGGQDPTLYQRREKAELKTADNIRALPW
jgi:hypothetical protein